MKKNCKKRVCFLLSSLLTGILLFTACSVNTAGKLESIKSEGKLVVYTNSEFPPFEYAKGNTVDGVDMEIARAIASELDVELEIKDAAFDGIIASLKSGKGDIAISGFTITDKRKKSVDFSKAYINSVQYLILPSDSEIATMEDLAGKRVGAALGYTGEFVLDDEISEGVLTDADVQKTTVNNAVDGVLDIKNNKLDAIIMDEYVAKKVVSTNDGIKTIKLVYDNGDEVSEEYGVAIPKKNPELVDIIDKVIDRLLDENKIEQWVIDHSL